MYILMWHCRLMSTTPAWRTTSSGLEFGTFSIQWPVLWWTMNRGISFGSRLLCMSVMIHFDSLLLSTDDTDLTFCSFWRWWTEQTPEMQEKVKHIVANGQLEFVGGGWCMNDEATVCTFLWNTHLQAAVRELNALFNFACRLSVCDWPNESWPPIHQWNLQCQAHCGMGHWPFWSL